MSWPGAATPATSRRSPHLLAGGAREASVAPGSYPLDVQGGRPRHAARPVPKHGGVIQPVFAGADRCAAGQVHERHIEPARDAFGEGGARLSHSGSTASTKREVSRGTGKRGRRPSRSLWSSPYRGSATRSRRRLLLLRTTD